MRHPMPFGADYTPERTVFRLWAPQAAGVKLQRFCTGSDEEPGARFLGEVPMRGPVEGVFTYTAPGNLKNEYYQYLLTDSNGNVTWSADPWALACGVNGQRSMVVDLAETDPSGWAKDRGPDLAGKAPVIWETHVRDFSSDPRSGVTPAHRGKYLAFTEADTTLDGAGDCPTCLNYLKQLGVTHIQLMPIFDYGSVDERCPEGGYNWGYDPENYNVPEGSYSSDPYHGEVRIRECKEMIRAIHRAGLGVVMDVVYNHTYRNDSWLERTAPGEYYRTMPDGSPANASGCGNETASDRKPFRDYMLSSLRYWAEEYHVDGFRFDLMAVHDVETMNLVRAALDRLPGGERLLTYGEPWSALPTRMHPEAIPAGKAAVRQFNSRLGIFCDDTRNALVGSPFTVFEKGYANGNPTDKLAERIRAAAHGWCDRARLGYANNPGQILQYASCHDNYTLWDRLTIEEGAQNYDCMEPHRLQCCKLVSGMCLTLPGLGFFLSGEEFGRTKHGDGNSYQGPEELNRLDWGRTELFADLVAWYRGLLGLREWLVPMGRLQPERAKGDYLEVPENCVGFRLDGEGTWSAFLVYYNPYETGKPVTLPAGEWQLLCDGKRSDLWKNDAPPVVSGGWMLPPCSAVVLGSC